MKKIIILSLFLVGGLLFSQILPLTLDKELYGGLKGGLDTLMFICLSFIMINVGREFELDKSRWRGYISDYFIAMVTAALPWIMVSVYYMLLLPSEYFTSWDAWKENLLIGRFAAPTSAGILFTMLAAAGLQHVWIYKKTQVLAIFDDLDTILLMIPLQIMLIGMKWQLFVIIAIICVLLYFGWKKLSYYNCNQSWWAILLWAIGIVSVSNLVYIISKKFFGPEGSIHIEVLLPAFVLGMVMKHNPHHHATKTELRMTDYISYIFMLLVGLSTPLFIKGDIESLDNVVNSITASQPMMSWGEIGINVLIVTLLSNIGKLFPVLCYRDRSIYERLALSIGMFTRGEVGAGILIIALGYNLGGPILIISILSLVLNLILTGIFVIFVKKLAVKVYGKMETSEAQDLLY
ncbi:MAG: sodium:proton antiporter [Bacteroidales bacterium]|nr:sodium:proton antiporter [Bacteroidales bacterium]